MDEGIGLFCYKARIHDPFDFGPAASPWSRGFPENEFHNHHALFRGPVGSLPGKSRTHLPWYFLPSVEHADPAPRWGFCLPEPGEFNFRPRAYVRFQCFFPTRKVIFLNDRPRSKGAIPFRNPQMAASARPPFLERCLGNSTSRASSCRST